MYPCAASDFMEKETSLACLLGSGLNVHFPLKCPFTYYRQIIIDDVLRWISIKNFNKIDDHEP